MPEHLRQYEEIVPGSAAKLMDAVYEAPSRRQDKLVQAEIDVNKTGQSAAVFLAVVCVLASIVFYALGNTVAGTAFLGVPLVQLILAFFPRPGANRPQSKD
ncbi:MAG: hypothetical protein LBH76_03825 [Propionibacteriaceae bacterium]|nr:hypothetical protein [Propionibacteriaceae bacterium]